MKVDTSMRPIIYFPVISALVLSCAGCANHLERAKASLSPEIMASHIEALEQEQRALLAEIEAELRIEAANSKGNKEAEARVAQLQELLLEIRQRIKDQKKRTKFIDGDIADEPYRSYVQRIKSERRLTHIQRAVVITTMNTPKWAYRWLYGDAVQRALVRGTLRKCGVRKVQWVPLAPVSHATDAKRQAWLDQVGALFA